MSRLEEAALSVLAGDSLDAVANRAELGSEVLRRAVCVYRTAGRAALRQRTSEPSSYWRLPAGSLDLDSMLVDQVAPWLERLPLVGRWWFLRGVEGTPHLRVRVFGTATAPPPGAEGLAYEPELAGVGGGDGLSLAHDLFVTDTAHLIGWLRTVRHPEPETVILERRDLLAIVLGHALLRGSQLDRFEQWDVWLQLGELSGAVPASEEPEWGAIIGQLRGTASGVLEDVLGSGGGELARNWERALYLAGGRLATAYREGRLQRGLRQVVAMHLLFHCNRLGLSRSTVAAIARVMDRALRSDDLSGRLTQLRAAASRSQRNNERGGG